ncbi:MAG: hemerythrin domain-containing protein [Nocardioides sp.]
MEPEPSPDLALLAALRRRRAELRDSMSALEGALAAPAPGPAPEGQSRWAERVHVALVELSADFQAHVEVTEGPEGLYRDLLAVAPRLSEPVAHLTQEHARIGQSLAGLLDLVRAEAGTPDVGRVRALGTALLGRLVRHRQRGSDLVYEAYEVDVGGET